MNPGPDTGYDFQCPFHNITTTSTYFGPVVVDINYANCGIAAEREQDLECFHLVTPASGPVWQVATTGVDTVNQRVGCVASSLSFVGVGLVPEPGPGLMLGAGVALLSWLQRLRRRRER